MGDNSFDTTVESLFKGMDIVFLFKIYFLIVSRNFINFQATQNTDQLIIILHVLLYQLPLNDL